MIEKKRFIAGAVCPRCGEMDKLRMFSADDIQYRECVACGFEDRLNANGLPEELGTRFNQTHDKTLTQAIPKTPDVEAVAVELKFYPPPKKS